MGAGTVRIRESHCVRIRYAKSGCTLCADACPHDAIAFAPAPVIDRAKCTGCMACVAACRTAALEAPSVLFWETLRQLAAVPDPVLGCSDGPAEVEAHATVPCVGYLTLEHLTALTTFLCDGVSLNLAACERCENHAVAQRALLTIEGLKEGLPSQIAARLAPVVHGDELDVADPITDRRGFFSALGSMVRSQALTVLAESRDTDVGKSPFWEKIVPRERLAFERIVDAFRTSEDTAGLQAACRILGYTAHIGEHCQLCFGCVGMCPNGALDSFEEDTVVDGEDVYREELQFIPSRCSGCRLCQEFCSSRAIVIEDGCAPAHALEWSTIYPVEARS